MRPPSAHVSDAPATDQAVWDDLSLVLDQLDTDARADVSPPDFYRQLLAKVAPLLAASHAAVWLRDADGSLRPIAQTADWSTAVDDRDAHQALVAAVIQTDTVAMLAPGEVLAGAANSSADYLLLAPVSLAEWTGGNRGVVAVIELALAAGRAPSSYQGAAELLSAICQVATEYHVRRELARLGSHGSRRESLLTFAERVGGDVDLRRTAMRVANEGCGVLGCDRLSVLTANRRGAKLLAASGTERVERRGRAARALERLATMATRMDEPIHYADTSETETDTLPQVDEVVSRYVDEFHARSLVVVPLPQRDEDSSAKTSGRSKTRGVLVAERFSGGSDSLDRMQLTELARAATPAIESAIAWNELPLGGVLRTLGWLRMPRTLFRLTAVAVVLLGVAAALLTIPAPLTVDVRGQLVPIERQDVFAPQSGIVDQLLVTHAEQVDAGQTVVELRDPELAIEIERLLGEQQQLDRQLEAVRATRTTAGTSERDPLELYRLSAEQEEIDTKLENVRSELALLKAQRKSLVVASPLVGTVTTWQVEQRLAPGRPVERGQVLLSVADTNGDWQLELELPDERLDMVREADQLPLKVEYRLGSDASEMHIATIVSVAERVDRTNSSEGNQTAVVRVEAMPDDDLPPELRAAALRPGGTVRARIVVGERSLGYVLTSDFWRALRNWWEF